MLKKTWPVGSVAWSSKASFGGQSRKLSSRIVPRTLLVGG